MARDGGTARWSALGVACCALLLAGGCGSGGGDVHVAGVSPVSSPAESATGPVAEPEIPAAARVGANRSLARAEAAREIRSFPVPPGATSIAAPPPHARHLRRLMTYVLPVDQTLTRTRFWLVHQDSDRVVAWYLHHTGADRDTASYHHGGRLAPAAGLSWRDGVHARAFSSPTHVLAYQRLGPHLTAIRADVTLAARADRTARTLVPADVTSLDIGRQTVDGSDSATTTVSTTDRAAIVRVIEAFDGLRGDDVSTESFGCADPTSMIRHRYLVTFHWPGHALAVDAGLPLCAIGRTLTLDGTKVPQRVALSVRLNRALKAAFDDA